MGPASACSRRQNPDLIIVVRKGQGKLVEPTIGGVPNHNERPVVLQPGNNGIRLGAATAAARCRRRRAARHRGSPQGRGGLGKTCWLFMPGGADCPLDHRPLWRYVAKDALRSPGVPVVCGIPQTPRRNRKARKEPAIVLGRSSDCCSHQPRMVHGGPGEFVK